MSSSEPLPTYPSSRYTLLTLAKSPPRWPPALRSACALTIPILFAWLLGYGHVMLLIAAGGYAVIYGEGYPYRTRWKVVATAGLLLVLASFAGAWVGVLQLYLFEATGSHWTFLVCVAFGAALAILGAYAHNALRLGSPGPLFIVMVAAGSTMLAARGIQPAEVGFWATIGAVSALVMGNFAWIVNPQVLPYPQVVHYPQIPLYPRISPRRQTQHYRQNRPSPQSHTYPQNMPPPQVKAII